MRKDLQDSYSVVDKKAKIIYTLTIETGIQFGDLNEYESNSRQREKTQTGSAART